MPRKKKVTEIQIKRVDKDVPMPEYSTPGSVGLDVFARERVEIKIGSVAKVPLNVILVDYPKGYAPFIFSRSSLPMKKGLSVPNGAGIIDLDYRGPKDEICAILHYENILADEKGKPRMKMVIEKGEKIGQLIFLPVLEQQEIVEVDECVELSRGGFGSTGGYKA